MNVESPTPEEVALAHRYRRWCLACLFIYSNPMGLRDVAHQLTVWEHRDLEIDTTQYRRTVYNTLYHDHLPALREANLVTYDQHDDEVKLGPTAVQIETAINDRLAAEIHTLLDAEAAAIDSSDERL